LTNSEVFYAATLVSVLASAFLMMFWEVFPVHKTTKKAILENREHKKRAREENDALEIKQEEFARLIRMSEISFV